MRTILVGLACCGALLGQSSKYLDNLKQLTNGGQNAEAYWSPDGKRLIFQSTRDNLQCDQIYIMDADGTNVHMVSSGKGRTTCGYFLADNKHILYGSTHEGGDACPPPADRSKGYVWAVYDTYDIYLATADGKIVKTLATGKGYDAEATVNFKTGRIVYTSMASGDLDLWTMKSDGSAKKQITTSVGYDGGAVFSRDGKKVVWRGNHPATPGALKKYKDLLADNLTTPMKMEIMIANADGKDAKQITSFGCAAFAPTFTPDGKKILFASNKHNCDGRKFELFLMNLDGSDVEQVTDFGGFTSFAEFSPDGKKLVFATDKGAKQRYEFNIFTADWKQ